MYDEAEYIYQEFNKNFAVKKEEPLILYGIGKRTGELLERIPGYQIAGLMDGKKKDGEIWGKPVLDYKDVLAYNKFFPRVVKSVRKNRISVPLDF